MKETDTYRKVFIKTEADLPKDGFYYTHSRFNHRHLVKEYFNPDSTQDRESWIKEIDWYLIEPESEGQSKEVSELEYCVQSFIRSHHLTKEWDEFRDQWFNLEFKQVYNQRTTKAINHLLNTTINPLTDQPKETADQPQPTKVEDYLKTKGIAPDKIIFCEDGVFAFKLATLLEEYRREGVPTDEEIVTWAETVDIENEDDMSPFKYMVFAAKWCRDKLNLK